MALCFTLFDVLEVYEHRLTWLMWRDALTGRASLAASVVCWGFLM